MKRCVKCDAPIYRPTLPRDEDERCVDCSDDWGAKERKARRSRSGPPLPTMMHGYAYELEGSARRRATAPDDDWAIVVVDAEEAEGAKFVGMRRIDGTVCRMFRARDGKIYAQTAAATGGGY